MKIPLKKHRRSFIPARQARSAHPSAMLSRQAAPLILILALLLANFVARAGTLYVDQSVSSSGDGSSWDMALKTIQEGINLAQNGDEVIVAVGTYIESIDFSGKAITVRSTNPTDPGTVALTVIEPAGFPEVVRFRSYENRGAVIAGFTITAGQVGISCVWSSPVIRNNVIVANTADLGQGGGISCYYSSPLIEHNIIASNIASGGGAGIACEGAVPVILSNLIIGNVTDIEGGGILCIDCSPTIARNRLLANSAQGNGGGVSCLGSRCEILNNLISSNIANSMGGGIACCSSLCKIAGNTIADNSAQGGGAGGIHFFDSSGVILNSILWGNGDDLSGCDATFSCIEHNGPEDQGEGNIHEAPSFEDPNGADNLLGTQDDDYRLSQGSPCLDKGSFAYAVKLSIEKHQFGLSLSWDPGTDLLGQPRVSGIGPDMGCCEYQAASPLYVLDSSSDLQHWSVLYQGMNTQFLLGVPQTGERAFFRASLGQK